jgi:hypothetical protein
METRLALFQKKEIRKVVSRENYLDAPESAKRLPSSGR